MDNINESEKIINIVYDLLLNWIKWDGSKNDKIVIHKTLEGLEKAIELNPKNDQAWALKGYCFSTMRKRVEALLFFDQALKINPRNYSALDWKGQALERLHRFDEAFKCFLALTKISPHPSSAWWWCGLLYMEKGDYKQALHSSNQSLKHDPGWTYAIEQKLECLQFLKRYDEALLFCKKILVKNPSAMVIEISWIWKGIILEEQKKYKESLACFNKVLKKNPRSEKGLFGKGLVYLDIDHKKALALFGKIIKLNPK